MLFIFFFFFLQLHALQWLFNFAWGQSTQTCNFFQSNLAMKSIINQRIKILFVVHRNLLAYNFQLNLQIFTIYNNSKSQSTSCYTSNFLFCKVCYKSKNQRTICYTSQFANLKLSIKFLMYKDIKIKESSAVCYTLQMEIYNFIQPNLLIYKILLRVEFVAFLY